MKVAIPKELRAHEHRVAASPDSIKKMIALGLDVSVETGAGRGASFTDEAYAAAGATIVRTAALLYKDAEIVLKVQRPQPGKEVAALKSGTTLIAILQPGQHAEEVAAWAAAGLTTFAVDQMPRITRAQSMDVLSSQSNLAGYKAVVEAAAIYGHAFPMMMTAAGTVPPARVVVMGAGVAGLQAIATARRLGAIVSAFDVRAAAKEQVMSLGASFIEVDPDATKDAETAGGYAREMGEDYQRRQREKIHEVLKKQDIVICTALIPGRPAPVLITAAMIADMKPGSVIVDLAAEAGGNAEGTKFGETIVTANGVTLVGPANMPAQISADASALYARNLLAFLGLIVDKETKQLKIDLNDDIIKGTLVTRDGRIVHPSFAPIAEAPPAPFIETPSFEAPAPELPIYEPPTSEAPSAPVTE